ncbi:hypothetical protein [Enterobacter hormaechei]|uniref:hypothetical protein n=1 Tax=Enterobacter hormaechei TaxID=158836 RepID=UPI0004B5DCF0|nr:hypothetical protein [Enterobacter hormaechei]
MNVVVALFGCHGMAVLRFSVIPGLIICAAFGFVRALGFGLFVPGFQGVGFVLVGCVGGSRFVVLFFFVLLGRCDLLVCWRLGGHVGFALLSAGLCFFFVALGRVHILGFVGVGVLLLGRVAVALVVVVGGWVRARVDCRAGISFLAVSGVWCFDCVRGFIRSSLVSSPVGVLSLVSGCSLVVGGVVVSSRVLGPLSYVPARLVVLIFWVDVGSAFWLALVCARVGFLFWVWSVRPLRALFCAVSLFRSPLARAVSWFFSALGYFWVSTPLLRAFFSAGAFVLFGVCALAVGVLPRLPEGKLDSAYLLFGSVALLLFSGQLTFVGSACWVFTL